MRESSFQAKLIRKIESIFPGCLVLKNDSSYIQGIPDLLVLFQNRWAMLECKTDANAPTRPNQQYYVDLLNQMSYAAFIYPENELEILDELQLALGARR